MEKSQIYQILYLVITYLIGAIPFSFIVGKARGIDLRKVGSGNLGATNTFRAVGKGFGLLVMFLDAMKAFLPIYFFEEFVKQMQIPSKELFIQISIMKLVIGIVVILGHVFPIYMKFKGGKGVASTLGMFLAIAPKPILIVFGLFIVIVAITKMVSVGSIISAFVFPFLIIYFFPKDHILLGFSIVIAFFIIFKHRSNIKRIINGTENKLNFSSKK